MSKGAATGISVAPISTLELCAIICDNTVFSEPLLASMRATLETADMDSRLSSSVGEDGTSADRNNSIHPYQNIISTKPRRILVGAEQRAYYLHPALVGKHSRDLYTMMTNDKFNGRTSVITDAGEVTFASFAEFIYTGDYTPVDHSIAGTEPIDLDDRSTVMATPVTTVDDAEPEPPRFGKRYRSKKVVRKAPSMRSNFIEATCAEEEMKESATTTHHTDQPVLIEPELSKQEKMWTTFTTRKFEEVAAPRPAARANVAPNEDYREVFLSHAKVFVFAEYWHVQGLATLALRKLHDTLVKFTLYPERVDDIASLVQYAYGRDYHGGDCLGLRNLVMDYVA